MTEIEMKERSEMSKKIERLTTELDLQERSFLALWNEFCELNREFIALTKERDNLSKELEEECNYSINLLVKSLQLEKKLHTIENTPCWKKWAKKLVRRVLGFR